MAAIQALRLPAASGGVLCTGAPSAWNVHAAAQRTRTRSCSVLAQAYRYHGVGLSEALMRTNALHRVDSVPNEAAVFTDDLRV